MTLGQRAFPSAKARLLGQRRVDAVVEALAHDHVSKHSSIYASRPRRMGFLSAN